VSVPIAYITIVAIWSTTPLAIAWSAETLSPVAAVGGRMLVAVIVGYGLLRVMGLRLNWSRQALETYGYSQLGIAGAMLCVYSASAYIPSGLISVLFALAPLFSNLFAQIFIGRSEMTGFRLLAFLVSLSGLVLICLDEVVVSGQGWVGVLLLLVSVNLYSFSGAMVQKIALKEHPMVITVGSLMLSLPLFFIAWWFMDGTVPNIDWGSRSPYALLYLAVFGSLIGFSAYFYVLRELGVASVAMATLVTPVLALVMGSLLNEEAVTPKLAFGTALILLGLVLYYKDAIFKRRRASRASVEPTLVE
jgi:drug/metabolite transporter (DMT)-like permease